MRIEDEIKQKSFQNAWHKAQVNLMYTANSWREKETEFFSSFGINAQQYNVLRIIKGRHPEVISPGEIKEVMLDKGVDLTRLVDKLVQQNLVKRQVCSQNRRKVDIKLTEKGIALLNQILPEINILTSGIKKLITETEAEQLSLLLDKIRG